MFAISPVSTTSNQGSGHSWGYFCSGVIPSRLGALCFSLGGLLSWPSDQRISAAVVSIPFNKEAQASVIFSRSIKLLPDAVKASIFIESQPNVVQIIRNQ